jgi:tripartite-type tricarboxylate transporter receptor subunit TctC
MGLAACSSSGSSSSSASSSGASTSGGGSSAGDSATAAASAKFDHNQLTVIIPAAPGGNLDTNVRLLQPALQSALGATVVVQNNAVGSGLGAAQQVVQMGADCSQIIANNIPALLYNLKKSSTVIQSDEFTPIANILADYGTIQVLKTSKWKTFNDFIADAKANPGKITISVASTVVSNYQGMLDL